MKNSTYDTTSSNLSQSQDLQQFLYICKDLASELRKLIITYAVVHVSEERQGKLGEPLKGINRDDFQLFEWLLHVFNHKPKLIVDISNNKNPRCYFRLTSQVTLPVKLSINYVQKIIAIVQSCDFQRLIFSTGLLVDDPITVLQVRDK
ncbi:unnamed protein product [Ambrosiozyma monospora]|uniref:Unnamed protein product n=1 Tax=Ambrosiozyma monospora TaxID=43982 RepID=A0ACB5U9Q9_AMBMO|nr:unnamed protein product [Ambrosiozyma monospora]